MLCDRDPRKNKARAWKKDENPNPKKMVEKSPGPAAYSRDENFQKQHQKQGKVMSQRHGVGQTF